MSNTVTEAQDKVIETTREIKSGSWDRLQLEEALEKIEELTEDIRQLLALQAEEQKRSEAVVNAALKQITAILAKLSKK